MSAAAAHFIGLLRHANVQQMGVRGPLPLQFLEVCKANEQLSIFSIVFRFSLRFSFLGKKAIFSYIFWLAARLRQREFLASCFETFEGS